MINELTDELLATPVRWATCVTDDRHLEWNITPTLAEVLGIEQRDWVEEGLDGGCWLIKFADGDPNEAPLTVARLGTSREDWYSLGPWSGPGGCQEARRCGFVRQPEGVPPVPLYKVGMILYRASTQMVEDRRECPDCLGTGSWTATSGAGEEFPVRCPRCDGRKHLSKLVPGAVGTMFHIRSIEARTDRGHRGSAVTYYDSTGCCGSTAAEWELFPTEAEAVAFGELKARRERARQEAREKAGNVEDMRIWTVTNAKIREAQQEASRAQYDLQDLRERIANLTDNDGVSIGGPPLGDVSVEGTEHLAEVRATLTKEQLRAVQNELTRWDEDEARWLHEWRGERVCACD